MSGISFEAVSDESVSGDNIILSITFTGRLARTIIPYSGYGGQGLQSFTTARVVTLAAGQSLAIKQTPTDPEVIAIRVSSDTNYMINGAGAVGVLPAQSYTSFADHVLFVTFPDGGVIEVM